MMQGVIKDSAFNSTFLGFYVGDHFALKMLSAAPHLSLRVGLMECHFNFLLFQVQEKVRTVGNYQTGNFRHTVQEFAV